MDGALALLGLGLMCFGGVLVAEGMRRSAAARRRARMPGAPPLHQDSGYRHAGLRGRFDDVGRFARARYEKLGDKRLSPGAPLVGIGLLTIGVGLLLIAQVLGR